MTTKQLNWKPVVSSLIKLLQTEKYRVLYVHDGQDYHHYSKRHTLRTTRFKASKAICEVDESHLVVEDLSQGSGYTLTLFLVLGNSPEEIVADCSCNQRLDEVLEAFSTFWQGAPCPTKTQP
jgi:hypothetical protein